jgi:hypothetical protein
MLIQDLARRAATNEGDGQFEHVVGPTQLAGTPIGQTEASWVALRNRYRLFSCPRPLRRSAVEMMSPNFSDKPIGSTRETTFM